MLFMIVGTGVFWLTFILTAYVLESGGCWIDDKIGTIDGVGFVSLVAILFFVIPFSGTVALFIFYRECFGVFEISKSTGMFEEEGMVLAMGLSLFFCIGILLLATAIGCLRDELKEIKEEEAKYARFRRQERKGLVSRLFKNKFR